MFRGRTQLLQEPKALRARAENADQEQPEEVTADYFELAEDVAVEEIGAGEAAGALNRNKGRQDRSGKTFANDDERLSACEEALDYVFGDRVFLENALTHSSSAVGARQDNERLEFFGDAVLDLVVREYLYHHFPSSDEGELTEAKSNMVCRSSLVIAAREIGLQNFLHLGRGISRRRSIPESLLADAFEAVVAAIYLDGGYGAARRFVLAALEQDMSNAVRQASSANFKSALQKLVQQRRMPLPAYRVLATSGPEHSRVFQVAVMIDGREMGRGVGSSKKAAEQEAAQCALKCYEYGMD